MQNIWQDDPEGDCMAAITSIRVVLQKFLLKIFKFLETKFLVIIFTAYLSAAHFTIVFFIKFTQKLWMFKIC